MKIEFFKKYKWLIVVMIIIVLYSKTKKSRTYDDGYYAGWNNQSINYFYSNEERLGYEQGMSDGAAYDEGYDNALQRKAPQYLDDPDYMDGYNDAKKYA